VRLAQQDTYVATVGGVTLREPAADLATALAVASAVNDRPLPPGLVALGEVGLAGDVRPVSAVTQRLAEAARLGFTSALVPPGTVTIPDGMDVTVVDNLGTAIMRAFNRAR
jgi:DNA repair protein RadA/Sms